MGQYYKAILLAEKDEQQAHEFIRAFILAFTGQKLMEHSYIDDPFVKCVESLLTPEGMFYKTRLVWAGDYADVEANQEKNLYQIADEDKNAQKELLTRTLVSADYRYILNHTKQLYVDKNKCKNTIHPLPLLTAEGNGRGGGDYRGTNLELVGSWARDVISVERVMPNHFTELVCGFGDDETY